VVHAVERRAPLTVPRLQPERLGHLDERLGRKPAVLALGDAQTAHHAGALIRVRRRSLADLVLQAHLSTSPITLSSAPTIAIMSATSASRMQVAVASRATNEGARN